MRNSGCECERKNAFVDAREPKIEEQSQGVVPKSHFERACEALSIAVHAVYSLEAKGRIERSHAVYQDRLVKELRFAGISTIKAANRFLREHSLPAINAKFAKPKLRPENTHVPLHSPLSLADIFCYETLRVVSNDYVASYKCSLHAPPDPKGIFKNS